MRTILTAASVYARLMEIEFIADISHIQAILPSIIINSPKKRACIHNIFGYKHKSFKPLDKDVFDLVVENKHDLGFDKDLCEKLAVLREDGINIFSDAGISLYKGKLPNNYKKDIRIEYKIEFAPLNASSLCPINQKEIDKIVLPATGFTYLNEISELKDSLNAVVLSQENAVNEVCNALIKDKFKENKNLPKGILFFLGAPATGKTFLAQNLEHLLKDFTASKVFDMTQFTHHESGGTLYGTAQFWGNAQPGILSSFVRKHPKSIIIFDEFEKANASVQSNLLSILSDGYLEDACGWFKKDGEPWQKDKVDSYKDPSVITRVDFSQTIVIFTSNLGKEVYEDTKLLQKYKDKNQELTEMIYQSISKQKVSSTHGEVPAISPEFLSRLKQGSTVLFQKLQYKDLLSIATSVFEKEQKSFSKVYEMKISYEKELLDILLLNFAPSFDVRAIKAGISKQIIDEITGHYIAFKKPISRVTVRLTLKDKAFMKTLLEDNDLLQTFKRKRSHLSFSKKLTYQNKVLKLMISDVQISKISNAQDFAQDGLCIEVPNVSFKDIAGHSLVKDKLVEQVNLFKNYEEINELGIKMSKGILLYGPPGTGKTMLAKALAHEADLPFIATTGEKLLNSDEIKKIFTLAKEYAPSIIFIDEIDAFSNRAESSEAMGILVNQLLTSIDGFTTSTDEPVYIVAATNIKDKLDPALLRSGRIDLHIEVNALDYEAREYFIHKMLDNKHFDNKVDSHQVIKYSAGLNGSDLEKLQSEVLLNAFKNTNFNISTEDILEQINTLKYGKKLDNKKLGSILEATAYHEAGHAILAKVLTPHNPIEQVTIMPRANALGFVSFSIENDDYHATDLSSLKNEVYVLLAGRAAQEKKFGALGIDAGASSDLKKANQYIYKAITRYGMDEKLKNINTSMFDTKASLYSNDIIFTRQEVWINEASAKTKRLVEIYWKSIEALAKDLLKKEVIDGKALGNYLSKEESLIEPQAAYQASLFDDITLA